MVPISSPTRIMVEEIFDYPDEIENKEAKGG